MDVCACVCWRVDSSPLDLQGSVRPGRLCPQLPTAAHSCPHRRRIRPAFQSWDSFQWWQSTLSPAGCSQVPLQEALGPGWKRGVCIPNLTLLKPNPHIQTQNPVNSPWPMSCPLHLLEC